MFESRRCLCRKDSQVADAILIKLLLGNNGMAFAKWARFSEMRRREACTSCAQRKGIFSLPYTETEPLAERHANTKLFLSLLFFFYFYLRTACRGHITPFTFSADLWGCSSCSMPGCYATHTQSTRSPAATRAPQQTARRGRAISMNAEVNLRAEAVLSSSSD